MPAVDGEGDRKIPLGVRMRADEDDSKASGPARSELAPLEMRQERAKRIKVEHDPVGSGLDEDLPLVADPSQADIVDAPLGSVDGKRAPVQEGSSSDRKAEAAPAELSLPPLEFGPRLPADILDPSARPPAAAGELMKGAAAAMSPAERASAIEWACAATPPTGAARHLQADLICALRNAMTAAERVAYHDRVFDHATLPHGGLEHPSVVTATGRRLLQLKMEWLAMDPAARAEALGAAHRLDDLPRADDPALVNVMRLRRMIVLTCAKGMSPAQRQQLWQRLLEAADLPAPADPPARGDRRDSACTFRFDLIRDLCREAPAAERASWFRAALASPTRSLRDPGFQTGHSFIDALCDAARRRGQCGSLLQIAVEERALQAPGSPDYADAADDLALRSRVFASMYPACSEAEKLVVLSALARPAPRIGDAAWNQQARDVRGSVLRGIGEAGRAALLGKLLAPSPVLAPGVALWPEDVGERAEVFRELLASIPDAELEHAKGMALDPATVDPGRPRQCIELRKMCLIPCYQRLSPAQRRALLAESMLADPQLPQNVNTLTVRSASFGALLSLLTPEERNKQRSLLDVLLVGLE